MATKGFRHTGQLPGTGKRVGSSAKCIVYDHKRELVYLSTDNPQLAKDVAYAQDLRDQNGEYAAYELAGNAWCEISVQLPRQRPARISHNPPLFLLCLSNVWSAAFSFLL
jgi:hypothetical protein